MQSQGTAQTTKRIPLTTWDSSIAIATPKLFRRPAAYRQIPAEDVLSVNFTEIGEPTPIIYVAHYCEDENPLKLVETTINIKFPTMEDTFLLLLMCSLTSFVDSRPPLWRTSTVTPPGS